MQALRYILAGGLALSAAPAAARDLYWSQLDVHARLDAKGHLHVSERHRMVFSGDWNGGERSFDIRNGQDLVLESIARVSPGGNEQPLSEAGLRNVDEYAWFDPYILRWRSRAPTDPPFDETELVYRIDYQLFDVLGVEGERDFIFSHDFAFADRPGVIQELNVRLEVDPAWQLAEPQPIELERQALAPGETLVVTLPLHHIGAEPPEPSTWLERRLRHLPAHLPLRIGLIIGLVAAAFGLWAGLMSRARARGHLAPLTPDADIDDTWVVKHVLAYKPEVVGSIYDQDIGEAEVAALLARLELEGKVHSVALPTAEGFSNTELELTLRVPRDVFVSYERSLVDRLFFAGDSTSTARIHEHYQQSGFRPAAALHALADEVSAVLAAGRKTRENLPGLRALSAAPVVFGMNVLVVQMLASRNDWNVIPVLVATTTGLLFFGVWGAACAAQFRNDVVDPERAARPLRGSITFVCVVFVPLMLSIPKLGPLGLLLFCALAISVVASLLWLAVPQHYPAAIALRKHLAAARRYFEHQLREQAPRLDDQWFPYLIALGLAPDIDAWFSAFDGPKRRERERPRDRTPLSKTSTQGSAPTPEPAPSTAPIWTGGGGRFGGGGASGSWSSAAASIASGFAAPGSSSDSGSSSSSTSSSSSSSSDARSGGGGGGGW